MTNDRPLMALMSLKEVYSTKDEALSEIEREIAVRLRCYDRWIADGKLTYIDGRDRLKRLISAWHYVTTSGDLPTGREGE